MKGICLFYKTTVLSMVITLCMAVSSAQVRLPRLVSDSMVLQRDSRTRVWGWASPGEKVMVHLMERYIRQQRLPMGNGR